MFLNAAFYLTTLGMVSQTEFLTNLGIADALSPPNEGDPSPSTHSTSSGQAGSGQALDEYHARRRAVIELLDPAGLGRIRVLVQAKGVADCSLTGLGGRSA